MSERKIILVFSKSAFSTRILLFAFALATVSECRSEDYFLTVGGGHNPMNNQASLEKNVLFQRQVLVEKRADNPTHIIHFADGHDPSRDLQWRDTDRLDAYPLSHRLLGILFSDRHGMDLSYRNHQISGAAPATRASLKQSLQDLGLELSAGDRLVIYATGHGGPAAIAESDDEELQIDARCNTRLHMWESDSVTVEEFSKWLDEIPRRVDVVLIMVQCYSGGFANTLFNEGNSQLGMSSQIRVGFFSQVHDRVSAGCTAAVDSSDYQEYSRYFWEGLREKTFDGRRVDGVDLDGNGDISFLEAHAYAVIESDTVDIPIRSSELMLRQYSGVDPAANDDPQSVDTCFRSDTSLFELASAASAEQRVIIQRLCARVGLDEREAVSEVDGEIETAKEEIERLEEQLSVAERRRDESLDRLKNRVRRRWPELYHGLVPYSIELATMHSEEFREFVSSLGAYDAWEAATNYVEEVESQLVGLQHREAKLQRLIRACDSVSLEINFRKTASRSEKRTYERMLTIERSTLERHSESNTNTD